MLTSFCAGNLLWDLKFQPYMPIVLGLWFYLNLPWMLLVAVGFTKSSDRPMVLLIATRHAWLRVVSLNMKESTTPKPLVLLLNRLLFDSFFSLLYLIIGRSVSLMYIMSSSMVPFKRLFICNNPWICWPCSAYSCLSPSQVPLWYKTSSAGLVHTIEWLSSIDWLSHFQGWYLLIYSDYESWYLQFACLCRWHSVHW